MKEKIMNFLEERTKNEVGYTTLSRNQIMEKLGIKEEKKFNEAFKELVQDNKVFFHNSSEEKINYDGSIFEVNKIKYFTNKDKSIEFKNNYEKKQEEIADKVLYMKKISKSNEEKFVLIDRGDILSKVLKREEIKENIKNKEKERQNGKNT